MPASLRVTGVSFRYPGRSSRPALSDVSLSAEAGQVLFLLGPNGSGKSTLFRILLRLLRPDTGEITIAGHALDGLGAGALARLVGYIPQQATVSFNYSARDAILMGRTPHLGRLGQRPTAEDHAAVEAAMTGLAIEHLADQGMQDMSGGECQLVMIARALCQQSRILVLDEPTSALDFGNQARVLGEVRRLADEGYLVVVSSHNPQQALQYADRVLLLRAGRVLASVPVGEVTQEQLSTLYDTPLSVFSAPHDPLLRACVPLSAPRSARPGSLSPVVRSAVEVSRASSRSADPPGGAL